MVLIATLIHSTVSCIQWGCFFNHLPTKLNDGIKANLLCLYMIINLRLPCIINRSHHSHLPFQFGNFLFVMSLFTKVSHFI